MFDSPIPSTSHAIRSVEHIANDSTSRRPSFGKRCCLETIYQQTTISDQWVFRSVTARSARCRKAVGKSQQPWIMVVYSEYYRPRTKEQKSLSHELTDDRNQPESYK
jgi:hypothetical protein